MREYINDYLEKYSKEDWYPWHMPGHKRQDVFTDDFWYGMFRRDFTEARALDDLHEPELFMKDSMEQMRAFYQTAATYMMVNGATGGILAAIAACVPQGSTILLGRNCHKSVYHAVALLRLEPEYLMPELIPGTCIYADITPGQVRKKLMELEAIGVRPAAVVLTSPTYEGVISDIRGVVSELAPYGIPLIVDEAHGAYLPFVEEKRFPWSAVTAGADVVIQSTHKTLPALTQTALLHVNNEALISRIERYLKVFQTSSPSYLLVQSIEKAVIYAASHADAWKTYMEKVRTFRKKCEAFHQIHLLEPGQMCYAYDIGKLVFMLPEERSGRTAGAEQTDPKNGSLDGAWLAETLAENNHQIVEMAGDCYVIAMTSIADEWEAYDRLYAAFAKIDAELAERPEIETDAKRTENGELSGNESAPGTSVNNAGSCDIAPQNVPHLPKKHMPPGLAWEQPKNRIRLASAEGCVAADFIYAYPPGTAVLCPGELIDRRVIEDITHMTYARLNMIGIYRKEGEIWVDVIIECGGEFDERGLKAMRKA